MRTRRRVYAIGVVVMIVVGVIRVSVWAPDRRERPPRPPISPVTGSQIALLPAQERPILDGETLDPRV
jgi:hypothetical protein